MARDSPWSGVSVVACDAPALLGVHRLRPRLGDGVEPANIAHGEAGKIVREERVEQRGALEVGQALNFQRHLLDRFARACGHVDFHRDIHRAGCAS